MSVVEPFDLEEIPSAREDVEGPILQFISQC
jgi:hypothetical protein